MTRQKGPDKNLQNVADDLNQMGINGHNNQQMNQDSNDRRHQDALNHDKQRNE
jgi:hypothetical protein